MGSAFWRILHVKFEIFKSVPRRRRKSYLPRNSLLIKKTPLLFRHIKDHKNNITSVKRKLLLVDFASTRHGGVRRLRRCVE